MASGGVENLGVANVGAIEIAEQIDGTCERDDANILPPDQALLKRLVYWRGPVRGILKGILAVWLIFGAPFSQQKWRIFEISHLIRLNVLFAVDSLHEFGVGLVSCH